MILDNCKFIRVTDISSPKGTSIILPRGGLYEEVSNEWYQQKYSEDFIKKTKELNIWYFEILFSERDGYIISQFIREDMLKRKKQLRKSKKRTKIHIKELNLEGNESEMELYMAFANYLKEHNIVKTHEEMVK